ncbi:hypothetical protein KC343_g3706 [Hortaea werneckii]|nr:hypothetical protein KC338_g6895 [Hortaea werneckii]KAI6873639.1 hypothetical protein KC323_g1062 [Hortaea werneckii]KAI7347667.1 hypothetical protein KC320_g7113 [Hortaea werneckii]KAI7568669.1 hypothetical protein KC317_g3986 [Hortaea werneckii]KAI7607238.1 hypothetical protein KC346_g10162 [Hortaea werneckii]
MNSPPKKPSAEKTQPSRWSLGLNMPKNFNPFSKSKAQTNTMAQSANQSSNNRTQSQDNCSSSTRPQAHKTAQQPLDDLEMVKKRQKRFPEVEKLRRHRIDELEGKRRSRSADPPRRRKSCVFDDFLGSPEELQTAFDHYYEQPELLPRRRAWERMMDGVHVEYSKESKGWFNEKIFSELGDGYDPAADEGVEERRARDLDALALLEPSSDGTIAPDQMPPSS